MHGRAIAPATDTFWDVNVPLMTRRSSARSTQVVAIRSLDEEMLRRRAPPKAQKPVRKRKLFDEMRSDSEVSIRRACPVFLVDTSTCNY